MKMPPPNVENQNSVLLLPEENLQVFKLLGNRCQTIATTVIQLFVTSPPQHMQWIKKDTGVLCFVKDNSKKNYFFRLFNLKKNLMTWEHEIYNNMEYIEAGPLFHYFEGEDCIVAFNFANNDEARSLKTNVDQKILLKKRKEEKRARVDSLQLTSLKPDIIVEPKSALEIRKNKRKRNITKADIGEPSGFQHISHVGFDPTYGFDCQFEDEKLKELFEKAGISERQLQDKDTRDFIYDFISKHGGIDQPPAVPPRAPTRLPSSNRPAPPPPPPISRIPKRSDINNSNVSINNISTSPVKKQQAPTVLDKELNCTAPPPPPPPPPPDNIPAPPPMMMMINSNSPTTPVVKPTATTIDGNAALMQSIRNGTSLRPVEEKKITPVDDARGDLLSEIRKGVTLKRVDDREMKSLPNSSPTSTGGNDLAKALAKALADRSKALHSEDDDDTSSTSNDDEWE